MAVAVLQREIGAIGSNGRRVSDEYELSKEEFKKELDPIDSSKRQGMRAAVETARTSTGVNEWSKWIICAIMHDVSTHDTLQLRLPSTTKDVDNAGLVLLTSVRIHLNVCSPTTKVESCCLVSANRTRSGHTILAYVRSRTVGSFH